MLCNSTHCRPASKFGLGQHSSLRSGRRPRREVEAKAQITVGFEDSVWFGGEVATLWHSSFCLVCIHTCVRASVCPRCTLINRLPVYWTVNRRGAHTFWGHGCGSRTMYSSGPETVCLLRPRDWTSVHTPQIKQCYQSTHIWIQVDSYQYTQSASKTLWLIVMIFYIQLYQRLRPTCSLAISYPTSYIMLHVTYNIVELRSYFMRTTG